MFSYSEFNQDISQWNVSNVKDMGLMFHESQFNQDISKWNVSNVINMSGIFGLSKLEHDLSDWKPSSLTSTHNLFEKSKLEGKQNLPYWSTVEIEFLQQAIDAYQLQKQLKSILDTNLEEKPMKHSKHGIIKI